MKLIISSSPHFKTKENIPDIMWNVLLALLPVIVFAIYLYHWDALRILIVSVVSCLITEFVVLKVRKKKISLLDGSCFVTGVLFALVLPPKIPSYAILVGAFFAIFFGKMIFGGLGFNIFNPALIGRAFLMAAYPVHLTTWNYPPALNVDSVTCATPLGLYKFSYIMTPLRDLFIGNIPGSLGETSALLILIGGLYLIFKGYADWRIPLSIILTVTVIAGILWLINPQRFASPLFHLFAGGLMLGAFFMATDPVTSPITKLGRYFFGIGIGSLIMLIRLKGGLPEGVMYSILIMNGLTPLINRLTLPRRFGERR